MKRKKRKYGEYFLNRNEALPGEVEMWAVVTGAVNPIMPGCAAACRAIAKMDGFVGVHPELKHTVWIFRTEETANKALWDMKNLHGINAGKEPGKIFIPKSDLKMLGIDFEEAENE